MGSAGTKWDASDVATVTRMNRKSVKVDTGANILGETTYPGMLVCPSSASGSLVADYLYRRDDANTTFLRILKSAGDVDTYLRFLAQGEVRFADSDSSNYVGFKAPATITANKIWTLPSADGIKNAMLATDAAGVLSFINAFQGKAFNSVVDIEHVSTQGTGTEVVSNTVYGIQISTGTTTNDDGRVYRDFLGASSSQPFIIFGHVRTGSDALSTISAEWGTYNGTNFALNTTQDTASIKFTAGGTNWVCRSGDGTTEQTTDSGVAYATSTLYRFIIISTGTEVRFYINGTLKATHSTNIPNSGTQYPSFYAKTSTTSSVLIRGEITMVIEE